MDAVKSRRALALFFCTLLTAYSAAWVYLVRHPPAATLGFDTRYHPLASNLEVTMVTPQGPAEHAGLRVGDRILAVNDTPLTTLEPFLVLRRDARPGAAVHVSATRAGQAIDALLVPVGRPGSPPGMGRSVLTRFGVGGVLLQVLTFYPLPFLLVAVTVLLQRPEDSRAWLLALMLGGFIASAPVAEFEFRIPEALRGGILAFWVLLLLPVAGITYAFFSVFPAHSAVDRRVPWLKWVAACGATALALPLAVAVFYAHGTSGLAWLEDRFPDQASLAWQAQVTYNVVFFLLAMVSLGFNAFGPPDVRRKTRVILFGMVVGIVPVMTMQIAAEALHVPPQSLPFALWALSIFALFAIPISLGYAVVKHRAMEIPVLLRRSARYVLVRRGLVTLAVLFGIGMTLGFARLVTGVTDLPVNELSAGLVAGSVFGGLLALVGQKAWQPAAERLDRAFFRGSYDARRLLETLADQSRVATDRTSLAELIDRSVVQALHPQTLLVFLRGNDDWSFEAAAHEGLSGAEATLPATPAQLAELARRGRPVLIDPAQLEPGGAWASFARLRPEAIVPMVGRSARIQGLLVLGPRLSEEPYSGEDVSLLASVGTQAGLALENIGLAESMATRLDADRRATHELEIARDVQSKLLPQDWPPLATLDYGGMCLQARVVGGDFFDFVSVGPRQVGLVLSDISGKGISAALLMASLQANLRALYRQAPNDLAGLLESVNRVFYDTTAPNHYATLFFGVYDAEAREMRYANCGHLPPVLLRADGRVERLEVTAGVIGMFTPWQCETRSVALDEGDLLVVFTDGVTEATSDDDLEFGEERLIEVLQAHRAENAITLLQTVVDEVRTHSGREQFDDLTLIVAKGT
jgi:phosphoserine phosphatase RsbU/P